MYQPAHGRFSVDDPAALLAELCAVVPATLVTHGADGFRTTVLPMLFDPDDGPNGTLRGHLARGNPHWRELEATAAGRGIGSADRGDGSADRGVDSSDRGPEAIAVFHGTDAYISPAWYEEKRATGKVVPTWNYVIVQAHGTITLRHEPEWLVPHVARLVERHEAGRDDPWALSDAPEDYVAGQARAIVGLELSITRLSAKAKLSQNRSDADIEGAIAGLAHGTPPERAMADIMQLDHEAHAGRTR